jgi:hypothetical protein
MRAVGLVMAMGLVAGVPVAAHAQAPPAANTATEKWVPVFEEPRHHLVVDTPTLRILDIQIPPGDTTLFHMHNSAMIYVPISSSRTRSQTLGEDWPAPSAAPAAATPAAAPATPPRPGRITGAANYVEKPTTHRVNNIGSTLFRLIGIANMTAGDAAPPAASATKPEMENRWYRVERLVIAPGTSAPVPSFAGAVVVVMQTPGTAAVDGAVWQPLNGPGDFARIDGSKPYLVHNRGAAEIEVVAVAVKGAKP